MIQISIISILFAGGVLAWLSEQFRPDGSRWVSLASIVACLLLLMNFNGNVSAALSGTSVAAQAQWWELVSAEWIPRFGVNLILGLDGLSYLLILLTLLLGIAGVLASWKEIHDRVGFFHFNYLWTLAGIVGVFTALDLFLFFFFWEVMLIPMLFLIAIWGHGNRIYAAIKFFIFTQASSLLMLFAIVALVYFNYQNTGVVTFDYRQLLDHGLAPTTAFWLMLGFFIAFAVKLPAVPLHTWLPDAHTQAPTAGSIILAAILLKTGAYGLIRFMLPIFPEASAAFAPVAMAIGAISILYGAKLAFAQSDMKRLVAYSSVSHMGFVLLGIFALNTLAIQGAIMQMIAHGLSTAGLFALVGMIQERIHTREMDRMGGLWIKAPRMAAIALFFAVASLGLPGLGNFIAEFTVLLGAFPTNRLATVLAAIGLIGAAVYALIMMQKVFFGKTRDQQADEPQAFADVTPRESVPLLAMALLLVALGLLPKLVFNLSAPSAETIAQAAQSVLPSSRLADTGATPALRQWP
ncbi:NADH-quinone oxidoreductase subunit M [Biformimicrobium ophioploci]|uniref:NADH-quinone oxidoreductase subunit M n=1 Tax=Biformimicrobium ophioploci TaxID=3036711 RepID=A0ABQ6LXC6_9GAMM|nr:NADH-quinone oxidoreductase subunit M [Microbulbifer sp. NKW57]GMG86677.1 NADH-quinone oxidoreductase subunit M [Microbulbifer sp. NKW57]